MVAVPYPSGAQYVEALQNPGLCFKDEELKSARVHLDKLGRPRPISGNFASVFALTAADGAKLAVKCFTRQIADQEARYNAVSNHLAAFDAPWKVGFDYKPQSVLVAGSWYPTVQMRWAQGTNLIRWIDQNVSQPERMATLASNFLALVKSLEGHGLAHGDLQHGNILVADDCTLTLVDYDGMYVPALAGYKASEQGHRNYQSPHRSTEFNANIDRFSAWVIYLSLVATVEQPSLWSQLRSSDGEYLLLSEEDFKDPAGSSRFPFLLNHGSASIRELSGQVLELVQLPTSSVPNLEEMILGPLTADPILPARQQVINLPSGTPAWMLPHLSPPAAPQVVSFGERTTTEKFFAALLPVVVIALVACAFAGLSSLVLVETIVAAFLSGWTISGYFLYRRRPEYDELVRRQTRRLEVRQQESAARRSHTDSRKKLEVFEKADRKRLDVLRGERESIQKDHKARAEAAERKLQQKVAALTKETAALMQKRQTALDSALKVEQQAHVETRLRSARLSGSKLTGIGPKVVSSLNSFGIYTAADFTGVRRIQSGQKSVPLLVLRSGASVKVPNIGDVKASTLEAWRRANLAAAERSMPMALSEMTRDAIVGRFIAAERQLADAQVQARKDSQSKKAEISHQLSVKLVELSAREGQSNATAAQTLVGLKRDNASAEATLNQLQPLVAQAELDLRSLSSVSFRRFLVFVATG